MITDNLVQAYLDDFNKILVTIDKTFCQGKTDKIYLLDQEKAIELTILENNCDDLVSYYYCDVNYEIEIGKEYEVMVQNARRTPLQYRFVVKQPKFEEKYTYDGNDLGSIVNDNMTTFTLWAPTASEVKLVMKYKDQKLNYDMNRKECGVYHLKFDRDLSGATYFYLVKVNGNYNEVIDPYAKLSLPNGKESVVFDMKRLKQNQVKMADFKNYTDAIIYEVSVQDYTKEKTFKAMSEDLDYLKDLKITHVQLQPVNDFYSVNEYHKDLYYNWGYDPIQYQVLEGSYSSNLIDPKQVVLDFSTLVNKMHQKGLRCVIDVVFNHMYSVGLSPLEKAVPYYYFRWDAGRLSDSTGCGNELESRSKMVSKLIIDTLEYFVKQFDVDGFRFDLMSVIDIETMKIVTERLKKLKPELMLYGEGWVMNSSLPNDKQSNSVNRNKLNQLAFFNDTYRDVIKGSTFKKEDKGYLSGQYNFVNTACDCLKGLLYTNVNQTINYVECHDNMTSFDKLRCCCVGETIDEIIARAKLLLGTVILSQGVPFIHAGQEFCGSKDLIDNTYNDIKHNILNKSDRYKYQDVVNYVKDMIEIRQRFKIAKTGSDVIFDVSVSSLKSSIEYKIKNCLNNQTMIILINPTLKEFDYYFNDPLMLHFMKDEKTHQLLTSYFTVPALSICVLGSDINDK